MGQWTSICKNDQCNNKIHWFLKCEDTVCKKCGTINTQKDIEHSWRSYDRGWQEARKNYFGED